MHDVVTVGGSPAVPSRCAAALGAVRREVAAAGFAAGAVEVRDLDAQGLVWARFDEPSVRAAIDAVQGARAVVVATPVYKAAYSGLLKAFLDLLPPGALAGKTVLPVATAGSLAHCLALDYALKPVLAALGARHILQGVCLTDADFLHYQDGAMELQPAAADRLAAAVDGLKAGLGAPAARAAEEVAA
jgi:FMN reductase